jgi:hypothetical protein
VVVAIAWIVFLELLRAEKAIQDVVIALLAHFKLLWACPAVIYVPMAHIQPTVVVAIAWIVFLELLRAEKAIQDVVLALLAHFKLLWACPAVIYVPMAHIQPTVVVLYVCCALLELSR